LRHLAGILDSLVFIFLRIGRQATAQPSPLWKNGFHHLAPFRTLSGFKEAGQEMQFGRKIKDSVTLRET